VVFIHNTVIDSGVNFSDGTQTFEVPFYVAKAKELAGTFTSIAVPLFFLISGFLLYIKEPKYIENLERNAGQYYYHISYGVFWSCFFCL
jgi:surface polysaccharide O-acyltransferase-like enzyme